MSDWLLLAICYRCMHHGLVRTPTISNRLYLGALQDVLFLNNITSMIGAKKFTRSTAHRVTCLP